MTSELFLHRRGSLPEAVGASFCLPGVGPPVTLDDRLLVDGGVMNNLPVEAVSEMGEGPVIASDVTAMFELPVRRLRAGPAAVRLRDIVLGRGSGVPLRLPEVIIRSITLGSSDTAQAAEKHADAVIRPDVSRVGLLAFDAIDEMIEAGRQGGAGGDRSPAGAGRVSAPPPQPGDRVGGRYDASWSRSPLARWGPCLPRPRRRRRGWR